MDAVRIDLRSSFRGDEGQVGNLSGVRFSSPPRAGAFRPRTKERCPMCSCNVTETVIDVRQIMPRMRHPLIFNIFDQLAPGEAFLLINDHNPRPLFYQFNVQRPGAFGWDYQEEGPDLWRVRISRAA